MSPYPDRGDGTLYNALSRLLDSAGPGMPNLVSP
jgi:hypothetical protein